VAVARIAGVGHQHFVVAVDERRAGQQQRRGGACRHDNARRIDREAVRVLVVPGDGLAQRLHTERARVLRHAAAQRGGCGLDNGLGRREVRLANAHVDDVASGVLELGGFLHQFHDIERLDLVDAGGDP
jgi:hypothetical protein